MQNRLVLKLHSRKIPPSKMAPEFLGLDAENPSRRLVRQNKRTCYFLFRPFDSRPIPAAVEKFTLSDGELFVFDRASPASAVKNTVGFISVRDCLLCTFKIRTARVCTARPLCARWLSILLCLCLCGVVFVLKLGDHLRLFGCISTCCSNSLEIIMSTKSHTTKRGCCRDR